MSNKKQDNIIGGIFLAFIIIVYISVGYYWGFYQKKQLDNDYRVTIAIITKREYPADGGEIAKIRYKVENKLYFGSFSIDNTKKITPQVGERFFIKYHPPNPNIIAVYKEFIVPDSLSAQPNGWNEIPVKINR